ncbi:MAG: hypothetical protein ABW167_22210 [Baekduia sp.]
MPSEPLQDSGRSAVLRFTFEAPVQVDQFAEALRALDQAYQSLLDYQRRLSRAEQLAASEKLGPMLDELASADVRSEARLGLLESHPSLRLVRIQAASPGVADLAGVGAGLEVFRQLMVDRDERRKDRSWREDQQRERAELENAMLRLEHARLEQDLDTARLQGIRERFEILSEIFGVEEARQVVARQLGEAGHAMDVAGLAPSELLAGPTSEGPDGGGGGGGGWFDGGPGDWPEDTPSSGELEPS